MLITSIYFGGRERKHDQGGMTQARRENKKWTRLLSVWIPFLLVRLWCTFAGGNAIKTNSARLRAVGSSSARREVPTARAVLWFLSYHRTAVSVLESAMWNSRKFSAVSANCSTSDTSFFIFFRTLSDEHNPKTAEKVKFAKSLNVKVAKFWRFKYTFWKKKIVFVNVKLWNLDAEF